jgi:hypothetical protein
MAWDWRHRQRKPHDRRIGAGHHWKRKLSSKNRSLTRRQRNQRLSAVESKSTKEAQARGKLKKIAETWSHASADWLMSGNRACPKMLSGKQAGPHAACYVRRQLEERQNKISATVDSDKTRWQLPHAGSQARVNKAMNEGWRQNKTWHEKSESRTCEIGKENSNSENQSPRPKRIEAKSNRCATGRGRKTRTLNDFGSCNTKSNKGKINSTHQLQKGFFH